MKLTPEIIYKYLSSRFDSYKVVGYNSQEFTTNSIFARDYGKHLSINLTSGLWQCFKTKRTGNFIRLVSELENISYDDAESFLIKKYCRGLKFLESHINSYFSNKEVTEETISSESIDILKYGSFLNKTTNPILKTKANIFLKERGLYAYSDKFLVGDKQSSYFGRIIIPFYDNKNRVFFFQARTLFGDTLKYLNPSFEECNVKSSDILFPFDNKEDDLFIVEGPLDAITVQSVGLNATSLQGSAISKNQISLIKRAKIKKIIISMDNDDAGKIAEKKIKDKFLKKGYISDNIFICHPKKEYKDWNDMFVREGKEVVSRYMRETTEKFDKLSEIYSTINGNSSDNNV